MARAFSTNQKLALLAKAQFHCQICGVKITWETCHADHVTPYIRGGKTIVSNGQALCAPCNLRKGDTIMRKSLPWQKDGLEKCIDDVTKKDFVIVAGTGCGKTHLGATCGSYEHLNSQEKTLILVVVPYRGIKNGWKVAFKSLGFDVATNKNRLAMDTDVMITTYAGAASVIDYFVNNIDKKLIIIFDEFHHMEENSVWARPFVNMDEDDYIKRIFLSGTPWHEKGEISETMVKYVNGVVVHDVLYTYGENVNSSLKEGKNTVAVQLHPFHAIAKNDGRSKKTGDKIVREYDTKKMTRSSSMTPLVDFCNVTELSRMDGAIDVVYSAVAKLKEIREVITNAAGIVFVKDKKAGLAVKAVMESDFDEKAMLISSDDPQAHSKINEFREGNIPDSRWIISIDMVSEGVDIPRLKVAADLTNVTTMMHIIQRWGRVLRLLRHESGAPAKNVEAHVFFIAHPQLCYVMEKIEEDMRKFKKSKVTGGDKPPESDFIPGESTETSEAANMFFKGEEIEKARAGIANWIMQSGYMDLLRKGLRFETALILAEQMISTDTVPEGYSKEKIVERPTIKEPIETKDSVKEEYKATTGRIGFNNFDGDHAKAGKIISKIWKERHNDEGWSCNNKTLEQYKERRDFMLEMENTLG